ncbi:hypothetical protein CRE_15022 [Caenorhabditis remanei]|uniref:7TM GPCR serpentine receptor class x (Srx) domain-containing protein n=1 Tax=Caenorhabditis remanei TaxID=31234 RepID=E3NJP0_CAERE|nr:hypothetical protein CRE_15022 [Caenorhabditis remanei]
MEDINLTAYALLPAALVGTVLNWAVFYSIHKLKSFNHSFGFLLTNQTLFDALNSTSFLIYFCPMVLL